MNPSQRIDIAEQVVDELPVDHPNYAALHVLVAIARYLQNIYTRQATQEDTSGDL